MELLVGCLAVLIVSASIIDWLLKDKALISLRHKLQETQEKITQLNLKAVVFYGNMWFCEIFDTLYGSNTWSRRRFFRSCFLSLIFILFSILIIGPKNTFLAHAVKPPGGFISIPSKFFLYAGLLLTIINLLVDFFSLVETRWVLEHARKKRIVAVGGWVCIDLILTTTIYFVGLGSGLFMTFWLLDKPLKVPYGLMLSPGFLNSLVSPDELLPFFISTFGTSIIWFLFVGFVLLGTVMHRSSRVLRLALVIISESPAPARTTAGIVAVPIVVVYGIMETFRWFFSN